MTLTDAIKAGASSTVLRVLGGLAVVSGLLVTAYNRMPDAADVRVRATLRVDDSVLPGLGVAIAVLDDGGRAASDSSTVLGQLPDGGSFVAILAHGGQPIGAGYSYWRCYVTTPVIDGGADPGPGFMGAGSQVVYDDDQVDPYTLLADGGAPPVIECWQQGRSDTPFQCACSTGPSCLQGDGGPAPMGVTLQAGQYVPSAACVPKACQELAGSSSWPSAQCGAP